jgi:hypothetical protein
MQPAIHQEKNPDIYRFDVRLFVANCLIKKIGGEMALCLFLFPYGVASSAVKYFVKQGCKTKE